MKLNVISFIWGFVEATVFFIVPDVFLSVAGRKKLKVGVIACFYALAGALLGGIIMYFWGLNDIDSARGCVDSVPAISQEMISDVQTDLAEQGFISIFIGGVSGIPYKIYAIQAAGAGIGIWLFMLISIPARLLRFVLITAFCHYALRLIKIWKSDLNELSILLPCWFIFYCFYFYILL